MVHKPDEEYILTVTPKLLKGGRAVINCGFSGKIFVLTYAL